MAANPNSNLVFDFPDPSPRFEFDESPTTGFGFGNNNSSKKGKGKKFGKLGLGKGSKAGKKLGGSGNNHDGGGSPSKHSLGSISSGNTATTTSLGASLDTSFGSSSATTSRAHSNSISPLKSRNNSGDIAAGPVPHFDLMPGQQQQQPQQGYFQSSSSPAKLNLPARPAPLNPSSSSLSNSSPKQQFSLGQQANANQQTLPKNHARHPSNASASGYISEVSEFSFDRVTVTTNETGMTGHSSNVSWNFLDEGVMTAINDATGGGQRGDNNSNNNNSKFVPYTGDSAAITTNNGNGNSSAPQNQRPSHHQQNQSTSTFSNVSLSDDDETDDIPFTGIVDSNQSVVSEISERTGGALEGGGNGSNAVKALLRDGMESAQRRHRHRGLSPDSRTSNNNNLSPERRTNITVVNSQSKNLTMIKEDKKCDGSPSRNTHSTARSTASGSNGGRTGNNFLGDIKSTYASFKQRRNDTVNNSNNNNINGNGNNNNNMGNKDTNNNKPPTILQSIIEDVQFCGLYLCGIDTTQANANGYNATKSAYEEAMKKKKEERKQETEDTFLGRVISCGGGGGINNEVPGCCGVVDF